MSSELETLDVMTNVNMPMLHMSAEMQTTEGGSKNRKEAKSRPYKDITGMRFGKLLAVEKTNVRDYKRSVIWKCVCSCGKECLFSEDALVHHKNSSCGCDWVNGNKYNNLDRVLHRVEGTCLEKLCITKARADSKTGYVGITLTANGQYRATIGFKGKRYYLGTYYDLEDAIAARRRGEKIHEEFLKENGVVLAGK